ncbi:unnamed protein product, partial [Protopolystoma xenopodis]
MPNLVFESILFIGSRNSPKLFIRVAKRRSNRPYSELGMSLETRELLIGSWSFSSNGFILTIQDFGSSNNEIEQSSSDELIDLQSLATHMTESEASSLAVMASNISPSGADSTTPSSILLPSLTFCHSTIVTTTASSNPTISQINDTSGFADTEFRSLLTTEKSISEPEDRMQAKRELIDFGDVKRMFNLPDAETEEEEDLDEEGVLIDAEEKSYAYGLGYHVPSEYDEAEKSKRQGENIEENTVKAEKEDALAMDKEIGASILNKNLLIEERQSQVCSK